MSELQKHSFPQLESLWTSNHEDWVDQPELLSVLAWHHPKYLSRQLGFTNNWHHDEWYDISVNGQQEILILGSRNSAKSTCLSYVYPSWRIGHNPNIRILLVSKTETLAKTHLHATKTTLDISEPYKLVFGTLKPRVPERWGNKDIQVERTDWRIKEPTMAARGLFGSTIGLRADIMILDDLIDAENVTTPLQRQKVVDEFKLVLLPILEPTGQLIIIGSRWHYNDFYEYIEKQASFYTKKYPAILDWDKRALLWPAKLTWKFLMDRLDKLGTIHFSSQFQCDPSLLEGVELKPEWLHIYEVLPDDLIVFFGVDLAISEEKEASYFVICVMGKSRSTGKVYLIDFFRDRISFPRQMQVIKEWYDRYKPVKIYIESNQFQSAMPQAMAADERYQHLPAIPTHTVKNKYTRITAMSAHFERARVFIGEGNAFDLFRLEWLHFPVGESVDMLDACEIGLRNVMSIETKKFGRKPKWVGAGERTYR